SPLKITSSDAPVSGTMAAHSDEYPANLSATNSALTPSAKALFCRMTARARRESATSQGSFVRPSLIRAAHGLGQPQPRLRLVGVGLQRLAAVPLRGGPVPRLGGHTGAPTGRADRPQGACSDCTPPPGRRGPRRWAVYCTAFHTGRAVSAPTVPVSLA